MNGVMIIYDNESNYFPFVRLEKMFFPREGSLEDRGNIFHGQLYLLHHLFFLAEVWKINFHNYLHKGAKDSIIKQDAFNA